MATQQDVLNAIQNLKNKTDLLYAAVNVPLSSLTLYKSQAELSATNASIYASGGIPVATNANATITMLKSALAAAPVNHASIPTTNSGTFVQGTNGDGLNPIRIPGANGTFTRLWMQNASSGNNGKTATLRDVTKIETLSSLGPAVAGLAEFISSDGSSRTKVWAAGGAWSTSSGSIADFCIGFTLTNARGFGIAGRLQGGLGHVYVSENGGPLTLCSQRMVWNLQDSYTYMDFGSVGTRNIVWIGKGGIETGELAIPTTATIKPYDWTAGKFLYSYMGDSWGQTSESVRGFSLPQATGKLLGASHIVGSTIGGTGFIADTSGSQPAGTNTTRLEAWTSGSPAILDCCLIVNDNINDQAALRTAVDKVLTTGRTRCPNALIVVTLWSSQGSRSTNKTGNEYIKMTIIRERARLLTGKWVIINGFDGVWETSDGTVKSVPSGPMITGEGSVASPTGTGNADTWIDEPGGRHPTSVGVIGIANYKAAMIKEAVASMSASTTIPTTTPSTFVAGQQQSFTLTTSTPIKYGISGTNSFYQKTLAAGTYTCGDDLFGDPAVGQAKACYLVGTDASSPPQSPSISTPPPAAPTASTIITGQTGSFTLTTSTPIKYGNKDTNLFYQRTLPAGTYICGDQLFGDPAVGQAKACYSVGTDASSPPQSPITTTPAPAPAPAPSGPTVSTMLTGQTGTFTLSSSIAVKYGNANTNSFYQRTLPAGTYVCGDELFGDPATGQAKACYVVGSDASSPPQSPVTSSPAPAPAPSTGTAITPRTFATKSAVFGGDSITIGVQQNTESYPYQWGVLTGLGVNNTAVSGEQFDWTKDNYSSKVAPLFNINTFNTYIVNCGTNSIANAGKTDLDLRVTIQALATAARATGFKFVATTITPRDTSGGYPWTAQMEAYRVAFNNWLLTDGTKFADVVLDYAGIPLTGGIAGNFFDGLHPRNSYSALMAEVTRVGLGLPKAGAAAPSPAPAPAPASNTIALLHMNEAPDGTYPAKWVNSISNGPTFTNRGSSGKVGGRSLGFAPFGMGGVMETQVGGEPAAVTADSMTTFTGSFTMEGFMANLDEDRDVMEFTDNGDSSGDMRFAVSLRSDGAGGFFAQVDGKKGAVDVNLFVTQNFVLRTIGGVANSIHWAFQRETDGSFTFRCNGVLLGTSTTKITGSLTGYLNLFGSHNRVTDSTNGVYRAYISELRASSIAVYSGNTYTVPVARF